jgi:hypothetical protein
MSLFSTRRDSVGKPLPLGSSSWWRTVGPIVLSSALIAGGGCDIAEPDPLPPRGDEVILQKARRRLEKARQEGRGSCARKERYYRDEDGDGYGDPEQSVKACLPPNGYVENGQDCYDANAKAHPKQHSYFHKHRGDGSFDYDCDSKEKRRILDRAFCRLKPDENGCYYASGWIQKRIPKCGEAGEWKWYECHEIHVPLLPDPAAATNGSEGGSAPQPAGGAQPAGSATGSTPAARRARPRPAEKAPRGQEEKEQGPKVLQTKVHYRCRGKRLPWKKMQLCR